MNWRQQLQIALDPARSIEIEDERHFAVDTHRAAAVLIPITDRAEPGVILTQRPTWLRSHAGQVAFPGGKVDEGDENAIAAALREAHEELCIPPAMVEVIGVADTYFSGSGYRIAPVIGVIPPDLALQPNHKQPQGRLRHQQRHLHFAKALTYPFSRSRAHKAFRVRMSWPKVRQNRPPP